MAGFVTYAILFTCWTSWMVDAELGLCGSGAGLKYLSGDALSSSLSCLGPDNTPYPTFAVEQSLKSRSRTGRANKVIDPLETRQTLLKFYEQANSGHDFNSIMLSQRRDRSLGQETAQQTRINKQQTCSGPGNRLCKTRYNTTAPLYGVSLTSGQPVTIVQKFPDLLQQVIYEVCDSTECDVVHGECVQTYVPYLFLVIPLGPVTLTGQDYVLVENGCVCRPKYGRPAGLQDSTTLTDVFAGVGN